MSKVRLEFLSWLTDALGAERAVNEVVLEQEIKDGNTVKELLVGLAARYPRFKQTVFDSKDHKLKAGVCILYNGRQLELEDGLETRLKDRDALVFVPVVAGG